MKKKYLKEFHINNFDDRDNENHDWVNKDKNHNNKANKCKN